MSNYVDDNLDLANFPKVDITSLPGVAAINKCEDADLNNIRNAINDIKSFLRGTFKVFKAADTTKLAHIDAVTANPNGSVTGTKGSLAIDVTNAKIYQNTDGAVAWVQIGGAVGSELFGDGSDGVLVFDGVATVLGMAPAANVYTLTRDIAASTMTVATGVTIKVDNFRVMCTGTLTLTGTAKIMSNGADAAARIGGAGGARNTHVFAAFVNDGASGANGPGVGNASTANGTAISQWPTVAASAAGANGTGKGQGGGGGTATNAGGTGGAITTGSVNQGLSSVLVLFRGGGADAIGGASFVVGGTGGGGGGAVGGSATGGGGGGGGGPVYVGARILAGSGTIESKGGAGGAPALVGGTGAGGGGGGGGGVVGVVFGTNIGTVTAVVTAGAGSAGVGTGVAGGNGSNGTVIQTALDGVSTV